MVVRPATRKWGSSPLGISSRKIGDWSPPGWTNRALGWYGTRGETSVPPHFEGAHVEEALGEEGGTKAGEGGYWHHAGEQAREHKRIRAARLARAFDIRRNAVVQGAHPCTDDLTLHCGILEETRARI